MRVRFWGVRADLPVPGRETLRFGGHTLCTTVTELQNTLCILDAGSGLVSLAEALMAGSYGDGRGRALFLISHGHWDHTQGIGFFGPFFVRGNRFTFYGLGSEKLAFYDTLEAQLDPVLSPLQTLNHLAARFAFRESDERSFWWGPLRIQSQLLPADAAHPGGHSPLAYRLSHAGSSLVYIPEVEHPFGTPPGKLIEFCRGASLLIHEAYFAADDYQPGWGHSAAVHAVELAAQAAVSQLALFHYNPAYDDARIEQMIVNCQTLVRKTVHPSLQVIGAREGLQLVV